MISEIALAFCGGLLGSAHCIGMCGAFALAVGAGGHGWFHNFSRQCVYSAGRMFTYGCGGLAAAFLGRQMQRQLPLWIPAQACLSIVAGLILTIQGIAFLGLPLIRWNGFKNGTACQAAAAFRTMMTSPGLSGVFLAGVATGFLPCALVYAYLALAARSGNLLLGVLLMVTMGLGTAPLMVLSGMGMSSLKLKTRKQILNLAAVLVLATGVTSLVRGGLYWFESNGQVPEKCPYCATSDR